MRKSSFLSLVAVAFLLGLPAAIQAGHGAEEQPRRERLRPGAGGPSGMMMGGLSPMALRHLQLSESQRAEIRAAVQQHREAHQSQFEELRNLRRELRQALTAETADRGRIEVVKQQIAAAVAQTVPAQIDLQVHIAGILTAEQRQRLAAMEERGPAGVERRGRGPARR
jgi:Spy/CpxP family protein refolding chaperone